MPGPGLPPVSRLMFTVWMNGSGQGLDTGLALLSSPLPIHKEFTISWHSAVHTISSQFEYSGSKLSHHREHCKFMLSPFQSLLVSSLSGMDPTILLISFNSTAYSRTRREPCFRVSSFSSCWILKSHQRRAEQYINYCNHRHRVMLIPQ